MFRKIRWSSLVILALSLVLSPTGYAQSTTGTITGTVTDQANAVVLGAELTLTNTLTGLVKHATTNRRGQYVLDFIPVGHYSLEVTDPGFGAKRPNLSTTWLRPVDMTRILAPECNAPFMTRTKETTPT